MSGKIRLWFLGLGGVLLMALFAVFSFLMREKAPLPDQRAAERLEAYRALQADDEKKLHSYAVIDQAQGTYQIPIQAAMELTVKQLNTPAVSPTPAITSTP